MTLFSYCVRFDTGLAPNPFWGICTLVICKPGIRRQAEVGDWIVGTGSCNSAAGDLSTSVVYAMRVSQVVSMAEYEQWVTDKCPKKRPDLTHPDPRRAKGDAVYDFSVDPPAVRPSVHTDADREHDLSGRFALLSDRFVYFGRSAAKLPIALCSLVKDGPGHRSTAKAPIAAGFVEWLESLGHPWGSVLAEPCEWPIATTRLSLGLPNNRSL